MTWLLFWPLPAGVTLTVGGALWRYAVGSVIAMAATVPHPYMFPNNVFAIGFGIERDERRQLIRRAYMSVVILGFLLLRAIPAAIGRI